MKAKEWRALLATDWQEVKERPLHIVTDIVDDLEAVEVTAHHS